MEKFLVSEFGFLNPKTPEKTHSWVEKCLTQKSEYIVVLISPAVDPPESPLGPAADIKFFLCSIEKNK